MSITETPVKVSAPALSVGRRVWVPSRNGIETITDVCAGTVQTFAGSVEDAVPLPQVGEYIYMDGEGFCYFLGWLDTNEGDNLRALVANHEATETRELARPAREWDARNTCFTGSPYLSADRTMNLMASVWQNAQDKNGKASQEDDARVSEAYARGFSEATEKAHNDLEA